MRLPARAGPRPGVVLSVFVNQLPPRPSFALELCLTIALFGSKTLGWTRAILP